TSINGSTLYTYSWRVYKELNAVPQAVPVSTCQRIISQTGCGTDILATVGQVIIVLEAIVLWTGKATLPLVAASFSLGLVVGHVLEPLPRATLRAGTQRGMVHRDQVRRRSRRVIRGHG